MKRSRLVLVVALGAATSFSTSLAFRVPGGGSKKADCYSEFEVEKGTPKGKVAVECVDGTDCDADGAADCSCTFKVGLCLNQTDPNLTKCMPHPPLTAAPTATLAGVKGATCGTTVPSAPSDLSGATCGTSASVTVNNRSKPGKKPKTGVCKMALTAAVGATPPTDKDKLVLKCLPNPSVTTCASTTTTTLPPTPCEQNMPECPKNPAGGPDEADLTVLGSGTDLDSGRTGQAHNFPVVSNSTLKGCLTTCGPTGTPPCQLDGPAGTGTINGETFGAPLPLLAAGVATCVVNRWNGDPTGTLDPTTGEATLQVNLLSDVHVTDAGHICPRCSGRNVGDSGTCDVGKNAGKQCTTDSVLTVATPPTTTDYRLSRTCVPDPSLKAASLDIQLRPTTGTSTLSGSKPCPGQELDDGCHGACGTTCTGNACVRKVTDPVTGGQICQDAKGGLSQNCCSDNTALSCFPTAGGGSITRTGKPSAPTPAFPDTTYPKTGGGVQATTFCIAATGASSVDSVAGLPGPGALILNGSQTWCKAP